MVHRALVLRVATVAVLGAAIVVASLRGWGAELMAWLPAFGYGLMAMTFGRTLRPGREPLITTYARLDFGRVPDECRAYTRRLTALWAALMGGFALETVAIRLSGDSRAWLAPANMVNLCLMIGIFMGEHWLRRIVFPHLPKPSPLRTGQIMFRSVFGR